MKRVKNSKKKIFILLCAFLCLQNAFGQSKYFIAKKGNDNNDGHSPSSAFQSINKVNSLILKPGDSVLFKCDDVFTGQLNIKQSGAPGKSIVISAYGDGSKPFIDGAVQIKNWLSKGANIWVADCPLCKDSVTGVYMNSLSLPLGRYPNIIDRNKGYLTIQSHVGSSEFSSEQPLSKNWVGAQAVVRDDDWILDKLPITAENGNTITLGGKTTYEIKNNWGFFIQNSLATLDENGEWYYDRSAKKLYLYLAGKNPNDYTIEATAFSRCINIGASYVTIKGIKVGQSLNYTIYGRNTSNLEISNVNVSNNGEDGILINGSGSNVKFTGNLIDHANNNGVAVINFSNFTFENNTIKNVGTQEGRGKNNNSQYVGVQYIYPGTEGNSVIKNNILDSIGYVGIDFRSSNILVQQNTISNFDLVKNDGGGIYTFNAKNPITRINQKVYNNIVYNGIGSLAGTPNHYTGATAIYLDMGSQNIEVRGNTLVNCTGAGLLVNGSSNITVYDNTAYGNNIQFMMTNLDQEGYPSKSNTITDNIFLPRNSQQVTEKLLLNDNKKSGDETSYTNTSFNRNIGTSVTVPKMLPENVLFKVNKTDQEQTIMLSGQYKDLKGNNYNGQAVIKPHSSMIFVKVD